MVRFPRAAGTLLLLMLAVESILGVSGTRHVWPTQVAALSRIAPASAPYTSVPVQKREAVDISGTYKGRIYYGDPSGDRYIMKGKATLDIRGSEVTLTGSDGRSVTGSIKTEQLSEKDNFPVGEIHFVNDNPIEIRWYKVGDKLKLVRAKNAMNSTRVFRFCSDSVTMAQCRNRL